MFSSPARLDRADRASSTQASQRDEDAHYYRQVLHELVEIGSRLARTIDRHAAPAPAPAAAPELSIAFERIARTIRRTVALARTLAEPAQPSPKGQACARAAAAAEQRRLAARKQIIRAVEDSIHREAHGRDAEAAALHAELYERLDTMDLDDDLESLPIAELIKAIRRDLGIDPHLNSRGISPWQRRRPQDVRALCARAAAAPRTAQPTATQPRPGEPPTRRGTGPPAP